MTTMTKTKNTESKPLLCRLAELYKELKQEERNYHYQRNDEGECATYAAAERLREIVNEYCADAPNTELSGGGPLSNKTTEAESRRPLE